MKLSKRMLSSLSVLILLMLAIAGCTAPVDTSASDARIADLEAQLAEAGEAMPDLGTIDFRLEWVASGYHAPFYLAQQEDLWRKRGLEVRISEGAGSGSAVEAVIGGAFDVAFADRGVAATAASNGGDVLSVMGVVNKGALTVSCRTDHGVASIDDLVGKTILTTISGSDGTLLPAFLALAGIDEADITVQNATPTTKTSLLVEGLGDCSTFVSYVQPPLVSYGTDGTDGIELVNLLWADHGLNIIGNGVVTSSGFAEENAEALTAFLAGLAEAYEMAVADPDMAVAAYSRQFPRDNAALAMVQLMASLESLNNENTEGHVTGYQPLEDWQSTIDALVDGGLIETALEYEAYFTNDYLPAE